MSTVPDASIAQLVARLGVDETVGLHETLGRAATFAAVTRADGSTQDGPGVVVPRLTSLPRLALDLAGDLTATDAADLEILDLLGEGGMGVVRRARQPSLRRDVAVKTLHPDADDGARHALMREGVLAGRLEHPNIVPVHMLGRDASDAPVVVMKRIEGVAWRDLIYDVEHPAWGGDVGQPGVQLDRHLEIFVDVCRAIEFAHSHDIVHRDIKPDNVMIGAFGEVYVLDWGVAAHLREVASAPASFVGTPAYMAPEMIPGAHPDRGVGLVTDVYLLGATLFELLTHRAPHEGHAGLMATLQAVASAPALEVEHARAELTAIVRHATQPDPSARFDSVTALREAVTDFLRHRGSIELTDRALDALDELRGLFEASAASATDHGDVRRRISEVFTTAQVALLGALDVWPNNDRARDALHELLTAMVDHAVARRNLGLAEQMLGQLDAPGQARVAAVATLRAELEAQTRADEELRALRHEHDLGQGQRTRNVALLLVTLVGVLVSAWLTLGPSTATELTLTELMAFEGGLLAVFAVITLAARRRLLSTVINRRITGSLGVVFGVIFVNRAVLYAGGGAVHEALRADLLIEAAALGILSLFVTSRLWLATLIALGGMALAGVAPHLAVESFAITNVFVPIVAIAAMTKRGHEDAG